MRKLYDNKKKTSDIGGVIGQVSGTLAHSYSQARRLHAIVIQELPPDRLSVLDVNDGATLVT